MEVYSGDSVGFNTFPSNEQSYKNSVNNNKSDNDKIKAINKLNETLKIVSNIEFGGRLAGSLGSDKVIEYINNRLTHANAEAIVRNQNVIPFIKEKDSKYQLPFVKWEDIYRVRMNNIVAKISGTIYSNKIILFTAHYDHLGERGGKYYLGADDNASGVSCLLELIDYFSLNKPKHTMIFFFTDGEELGLYGSEEFVKSQMNDVININDILLNINVDMIARLNNKLEWCGSLLVPKVIPFYQKFLQSQTIQIEYKGDDPNPDKKSEFFVNRSDQYFFYKGGVPFIFFNTGVNSFYHTEYDVFDSIDQEKFTQVYNFIFNLVVFTDDSLNGQDVFRPVVILPSEFHESIKAYYRPCR